MSQYSRFLFPLCSWACSIFARREQRQQRKTVGWPTAADTRTSRTRRRARLVGAMCCWPNGSCVFRHRKRSFMCEHPFSDLDGTDWIPEHSNCNSANRIIFLTTWLTWKLSFLVFQHLNNFLRIRFFVRQISTNTLSKNWPTRFPNFHKVPKWGQNIRDKDEKISVMWKKYFYKYRKSGSPIFKLYALTIFSSISMLKTIEHTKKLTVRKYASIELSYRCRYYRYSLEWSWPDI